MFREMSHGRLTGERLQEYGHRPVVFALTNTLDGFLPLDTTHNRAT